MYGFVTTVCKDCSNTSAIDWRSMSPWDAYVEILSPPRTMVYGCETLGRWLGLAEVMRSVLSWMGLVHLQESWESSPLSPPPCHGDAMRSQWSATQKRALTRTWPGWHPAPDFRFPELQEISFFCLWATQFMYFCYSSLSKLRQTDHRSCQ